MKYHMLKSPLIKNRLYEMFAYCEQKPGGGGSLTQGYFM